MFVEFTACGCTNAVALLKLAVEVNLQHNARVIDVGGAICNFRLEYKSGNQVRMSSLAYHAWIVFNCLMNMLFHGA